eukprot:gene104-67_t
MVDAGSSMDWKSAHGLFAEVATILDTNKPLPWSMAGDCIREADHHLSKQDTITFLERYWLRVIVNMTQFSPAKYGVVEKKIIEDTLFISAKIVSELLPDNFWALFILGRVFDGKIPFYYGTKTGFHLSTGFPSVRIAVAKKFAEYRGFQKVVQALRMGDGLWCGCDVLQCILGISNGYDTSLAIDEKVRQDLALVVMEKIVNLPDEVVKKENTESLSSVIQSIGTLVSFLSLKDIFHEKYYIFWFDCVVRYINSSSIVVKLFGWEQMADLIQDIKSERPLAPSFLVEGAGSPFVNGRYVLDPETVNNDPPQYVKADEGSPLLTLFRCNMRNSKSKWWFISQADIEKPGTEKDIDYYVHRSTFDEEGEPSPQNWTNTHPGMVLHGKVPCPTLKREHAGDEAASSIDFKLIRWLVDQEILNQVFNASMHREIINRSLKLLQFLQEYEALPASKLQEIWTAGVKSREKDITDEIFSTIVHLLATANVETFVDVLSFAADTLKTEDGFGKVISFLEKFSLDDFKSTNAIKSPVMVGKLLSLAWDVYSDSRFATAQGTAFIPELLSFCFKQKGGLDIVVQKVRECKDKLDVFASRSTGLVSAEEESAISQVLHTLFFLISKTGHHDVDAMESEAQSMIDSLVNEVIRFATSNRAQMESGKYISELRLRLQVLRKFYSIVICNDVEVIIDLWDKLCQSPEETDEFAFFLKGESHYDSIFVKNDVLTLYDRVFCSPEKIDWARVGDRTFDCFRSFFHLLESWGTYLIGHELPPKRGLSTLWNICLATTGKISHDAIELLLVSYDSFLATNDAAIAEFIQTVFDKLREYSSGDTLDNARAGRCIEILRQAMTKFGSGKSLSHAAKGTQGRIAFSVYYKRLNYSTHIDTLRFDKNSDGFVKLEMHPFHTIKMLKAKIIDAAHLTSSTSIIFDNAPKLLSDHARLCDLGDLDGGELTVSYQTNYSHRVYDDDVYGSYYSTGKSDEASFGVQLVDDLSKFDMLLSLCQQSNDTSLVQKVWTLLMMLPTQSNMLEMIRNMAIQNDPDYGPAFSSGESWKDILVDSSKARSSYLLQILDYMLRPAPEVEDLRAGAHSFLQSFGRSEGFATVVAALIQSSEVDDEISFTSLAVCLHIIYSLVFSTARPLSADSEDADEDQETDEPTIAEVSTAYLTGLSETDASVFIDKLLVLARGAAAREASNVVHDALVIISLVIRSPGAASQLMKKDYTRELLTSQSNDYDAILNDMERVTRLAGKQMHYYWGMQVSFDIKRPDIDFIGLKNQGCTCYMNSLLQVLYMCPRFRDAILNTPIREMHRTTLWHYNDIDLVNKRVMFEWSNNEWRSGRIVGYDPDSRNHRVQYERLDGSLDEIVAFNIHEGRLHRETGRVRMVPEDDAVVGEPINEREDAAIRVMEQLQRTFAFMKLSKKKYFDPRPFVDACKTLNLSFNVFHQNDASEFCDQLLDRVETASKGKHTKVDMWEDVFLKAVFGGKMLTQKIPQDCPAFNQDKDSCGLWQSPRLENYLKVEVQIRGKETVAESLEGLVQGELMDGDNKIKCDVCNEKKAAVMRTCIGTLPNVLLLHLKRFDLDFQTFETVKLNSKMEFPLRINMLRYTKDGIDRKKEGEEGEGEGRPVIQEENDVDPADYEYELQGILVHAGVAQGGHYYSFVRSYENPDLWFKFDDEDVTPFTADQIPEQCFGGPYTSGGGTSSTYDDDRTANALMLLYNKVKAPKETESALASPQSKEAPSASPKDLVTGVQAFEREVMESNLQHNLTCFLVDPELHAFVRSLITTVVHTPSSHSQEGLVERVLQFGVTFLLDVLLHFRERSAIKDYVNALKEAFEAFPATAFWFLSQLLSPPTCTWFTDYMLVCTDPLARASFVQLVVYAVAVVAPKDTNAVTAAFATLNRHVAGGDVADEPEWTPEELCARLVQKMFDLVFKSVNHVRTADEVFALVRDLSVFPSICHAFRSHNIISLLSYYVMPDGVPPQVKAIYDKQITPTKAGTRPDYTHLLQNVFEAIAALLGVPQVRKVNLLQEKSYWESELVAEAREAFTKIFHENSRNGYMDQFDVQQYMDKVLATTGSKASQVMIRNVMDRMSAQADHRVYLDGFLSYHTDNATVNPKNVWRLLLEPGLKDQLHVLAEENESIRYMRGSLKLNPTLNLTYDEETRVRGSRVVVSGAGTAEVNGEYIFTGFRANAGSYELQSTHQGKNVRYILYKCSLNSGGFQWFISVTPPGREPGTNADIDFYFTHSKHGDFLPPTTWFRLQNSNNGVDPTPKVEVILADGNTTSTSIPLQPTYDSDSDLEDDEAMVGDDSQYNGVGDSSFLSDA